MYDDFLSSELSNIVNARLSIFPEQCTSGTETAEDVFVMETESGDFLGVYEPDAATIANLLRENSKVNQTRHKKQDT